MAPISTVLNNPHKRQAPPKAHSHLPAVVPADLPRVRRKDFDSYLRAIAPEWDKFQHTGLDGTPSLPSSSSFPSPPAPNPSSVPPLDIVPQIFFASDFALSSPRTFAAVTANSDPTSLAHALPLLDTFSHYADTVEQHLVLEISHRAPSFFAALTNLHDLHAESAQCLARVSELRKSLAELDTNSAKKGLKLVRHQARAANLHATAEGVKQVASAVEMGRVARALVGAGQWGEALGVIDAIQRMWSPSPLPPPPPPSITDLPTLSEEPEPESESDDHAAPPPPKPQTQVPLASLHAYSALPEHLRALTSEIASALSTELVSVLRADLAQTPRHPDAELRDRLRPIAQGLVRTQGVEEALGAWREAVLGEVRAIVRAPLPNTEDETAEANRTHLREMPHSDFVLLLEGLYARLGSCLEGLQSQSAVLVGVLGPSSPTTDSASESLSDTLSTACETCSTLLSALLPPRLEAHSTLPLPAFLALYTPTWAFVVRSEVLARRMIVSLRGAVVSHAKAWLASFHGTRIAKGAREVEEERWEVVTVGREVQGVVDALVRGAVGGAPPPPLATPLSPHTPLGSPPPHLQAQAKHILIETRPYHAVAATVAVLLLLSEYIEVLGGLGLLAVDGMSRTVEFLKAFNSRTCQVVLGAGAMRSAGLRNITAKHLALASQSLSIMSELIPYVRETFRRHLSPKQAVMLIEFDKLKRAVDWAVPKPGGGVNDYMEVLVKETVTLHKVLSRYLSPSIVEYVMTQVFAAINHGLAEEYGRIELPHLEAKTRLLADAKYLHQKLSALKNVAAPSGMLVTVISEKGVPRTGPASPLPSPAPAPVPTPTRASTLGASANQRLKGLLSGKGSSFGDKAHTPTRTTSLAPPPILSPPPPPLPSMNGGGSPASPPRLPSMNGGSGQHREDARRPSSSTSSPPLPYAQRKASAGFKQVEFTNGNGTSDPVPSGAGADANGKLPDMGRRRLSPPLPPTPHDTPSPPEPAATEPELAPRTGVEDAGAAGEETQSGPRAQRAEAEPHAGVVADTGSGTEASEGALQMIPSQSQALNSESSDVEGPSSASPPILASSSSMPELPPPRSESPVSVADGAEL
ncbi:hypothetical protein DXG01_016409 [Tephrocybe rancida]|nr:hypothetical protein DXG01_016409 [Tephrocybe rancida]